MRANYTFLGLTRGANNKTGNAISEAISNSLDICVVLSTTYCHTIYQCIIIKLKFLKLTKNLVVRSKVMPPLTNTMYFINYNPS